MNQTTIKTVFTVWQKCGVLLLCITMHSMNRVNQFQEMMKDAGFINRCGMGEIHDGATPKRYYLLKVPAPGNLREL